MYSHTSQIRVRYGETDQMGYLYYGNYAQYYEIGRVEAIRSLGFSYKKMEEDGIALPVLELKSKFVKPAYYDELLSLKTMIVKMPDTRIYFDYELSNEKEELINIGSTTLVFYDIEKRKPIHAPEEVISALQPYFASQTVHE